MLAGLSTFFSSGVTDHCGADPLVRGRRPRRPSNGRMRLMFLEKSGPRGTRADQGSAPRFVRLLLPTKLLLRFGLAFGWWRRFGIPEREVAGGDFRWGVTQLGQPAAKNDLGA